MSMSGRSQFNREQSRFFATYVSVCLLQFSTSHSECSRMEPFTSASAVPTASAYDSITSDVDPL